MMKNDLGSPAGMGDKIHCPCGEMTMPAGNRIKMHAGGAKNGCNQRAYGGKFHAATVETTLPAGKRDENARRRG
ncbi:MAG: hypothetical protein ACLTXL_07390 [Clostridia bacterium]